MVRFVLVCGGIIALLWIWLLVHTPEGAAVQQWIVHR